MAVRSGEGGSGSAIAGAIWPAGKAGAAVTALGQAVPQLPTHCRVWAPVTSNGTARKVATISPERARALTGKMTDRGLGMMPPHSIRLRKKTGTRPRTKGVTCGFTKRLK
jgi:hypothetical protein